MFNTLYAVVLKPFSVVEEEHAALRGGTGALPVTLCMTVHIGWGGGEKNTQTRDVVVYRLITCGTVEEKIYRKQVFRFCRYRFPATDLNSKATWVGIQ